ncbi:hypothetical protein V2W45_1352044 [Cenococcum geophilum]
MLHHHALKSCSLAHPPLPPIPAFSNDMSYSRVGVVAGANKRIGLAIVRNLALQYPKSPPNDGCPLIYLTARDRGRGEAALQNLEKDVQLQKAKALVHHGGLAGIRFYEQSC